MRRPVKVPALSKLSHVMKAYFTKLEINFSTLESDTLKYRHTGLWLNSDTLDSELWHTVLRPLYSDTLDSDTLHIDTLHSDTLDTDIMDTDTLDTEIVTLTHQILETDTMDTDILDSKTLNSGHWTLDTGL